MPKVELSLKTRKSGLTLPLKTCESTQKPVGMVQPSTSCYPCYARRRYASCRRGKLLRASSYSGYGSRGGRESSGCQPGEPIIGHFGQHKPPTVCRLQPATKPLSPTSSSYVQPSPDARGELSAPDHQFVCSIAAALRRRRRRLIRSLRERLWALRWWLSALVVVRYEDNVERRRNLKLPFAHKAHCIISSAVQ